MKATAASILIVSLLLATAAWGVTTKITIEDIVLGTSIDITDRTALDSFHVWAGPGTFANDVEGRDGFIIDWAAGVAVDRPRGLRRYEVRFYAHRPNSSNEQLAYVVMYENEPSSGQGFVYLPGKSDEHYRLNTRSILRGHGLEGNWFRATTAWQTVVRTLTSVG
jgi:hypothetical protein